MRSILITIVGFMLVFSSFADVSLAAKGSEGLAEGSILLVINNKLKQPLSAELDQFVRDLKTEGYNVLDPAYITYTTAEIETSLRKAN